MNTMPHWFYSLADGVLTGDTYSGPAVEANTPPGHGAIAGVTDWRAQRVDLQTGALVPYTPPPPPLEVLRERALVRVQLAIDAAESKQARPVRELASAAASGSPAPSAAVQRLAEIETQIQDLRTARAAIVAATSSEELSAVGLPAPLS